MNEAIKPVENITKSSMEIINNKNLYELLRRKEMYSEYIDWEYKEHISNFINEIKELEVAIDNWKDIWKEFMDVIYMIGQLTNKLNRDWFLEDVDFKLQKDKIMSRSPNLKECKKISRETENKIRYALKSKQ